MLRVTSRMNIAQAWVRKSRRRLTLHRATVFFAARKNHLARARSAWVDSFVCTGLMKNFFALIFIFPVATLIASAVEDERPVVDAAKVPVEHVRSAALPTLHLVGDSTVKSGGSKGLFGWGERIAPFFDTEKINVVNQAIGGRSARTFFTEGRWSNVVAQIKAGDFVTIQFGHNDQGRIGDPAMKGRADGKGIGEETAEDTKPDGTKEFVHTFGWYMGQFAAEAKAKGATVVLVSPVPHKQRWEVGRDFETLADWDRQVAAKQRVLFLDLTLIVTETYKKIGRDQVATLFADKGTHTTDAGAQTNAACVVAGLKSLPGNPFGIFLSEKGRAVAAFQSSGETISTQTPANIR